MARPERPLLLAPAGVADPFQDPPDAGRRVPRSPNKLRQVERLDAALHALERTFSARREALPPDAATNEQVLVIETNGAVKEIEQAASSIRGVELLDEENLRDLPPDEDFCVADDPSKLVGAQRYLLLFDYEAVAALLSLWRTWASKPISPLPRAFRGWAKVFSTLRAIRPWGVRDRVEETAVLDRLRERVATGSESITVEIELWYREKNVEGEHRVREAVARAEGVVTSRCVLDAIAHHSLIAHLPIWTVELLLENPESGLLACEDIRLLRPAGHFQVAAHESESSRGGIAEAPAVLADPVVALLDGLPFEAHARLAGRLVVDDPDGWSASHPSDPRSRGTAMASLLVHGDLARHSPASRRRLYVHPITRFDARSPGREAVPDDVSPIDLVHRAVRRIVEGEEGGAAACPTAKVVHLSINDPSQRFVRAMSPLARLLDWLAWRYQMLFLVSAGDPLRLLSPGEAMNVLTLGIAYEAPDTPVPSRLGFRQSVKPDLLAPCRRAAVVAAPHADDTTATRSFGGVDLAVAAATRLAGALANVLDDLRGEPNEATLRSVPSAVWLRTLVAHGVSWGAGVEVAVEEALRAIGHESPSLEDVTSVLGFGRLDGERVVRCTAERATVLCAGSIAAGQRIVHRVPLPPSLAGYTGPRRLVVTLSWFSPIRPTHRKYRRAALWVDPPESPLGVSRRGVDWLTARRGTLQHEVLEGDRVAIVFPPEATLDIPVSCVEDAGPFDAPIDYALAVTIEVKPGSPVRVYDEMRSRLAANESSGGS